MAAPKKAKPPTLRMECPTCHRDVAALRNGSGTRQHTCPHGRYCGMQACHDCGTKDAVSAVVPGPTTTLPLRPYQQAAVDAALASDGLTIDETGRTGS